MATRPLKFQLTLGTTKITVPGSASGPHFAFQKIMGEEKPMLWLTVGEGEPCEVTVFVAITGEQLPGKHQEHLGTALTSDTGFVAHAYRIED